MTQLNVNHELNKQAVDSLELLTIKLHDSLLERQDDFIRDESDLTPELQAMQATKSMRLKGLADDGQEIDILRVLIRFGVRGLPSSGHPVGGPDNSEAPDGEGQNSERRILFRLEATFRADYRLKADVSKEALQEFIRFNATHNVWPFWRQHVLDLVARADLTEIQVGFFPGRRQ